MRLVKERGLVRELSAKFGVPQSHISKIENGAVDLRTSSLVALARVLDLELELVSKKTVPGAASSTLPISLKPVPCFHRLNTRSFSPWVNVRFARFIKSTHANQ